jgi:hypothetical protein
MFREWLEQFAAQSGGAQELDALMKRLKHVQAGRRSQMSSFRSPSQP